MTTYLFGFLLFVFVDAVICMAVQKRFNIIGSLLVGSLWFITIPVSILVVCCWQDKLSDHINKE